MGDFVTSIVCVPINMGRRVREHFVTLIEIGVRPNTFLDTSVLYNRP